MSEPGIIAPGALVMIPGAYFRSDDFAAHGFLAALGRHGCPMDVVVADLPTEAYLAGTTSPWLHANIVVPALARGYRRLWLLGISLGGMGALLYAQELPEVTEGIILLAPFLGTRGLVAEVETAGGLASWDPGVIAPRDIERRLMAQLRTAVPPRLHLGMAPPIATPRPAGCLPRACRRIVLSSPTAAMTGRPGSGYGARS